MGLTTFSLANLFFSFTARDALHSVLDLATFSDRTFVIASLASVVAIIFATELRFFQRILDTEELTGNQWLICIGAALSIVVASEIWKLVLRRRTGTAEPAEARRPTTRSRRSPRRDEPDGTGAGERAGHGRLGVVLAMAMFVLVVDTYLDDMTDLPSALGTRRPHTAPDAHGTPTLGGSRAARIPQTG
jgi:hypothetical protein